MHPKLKEDPREWLKFTGVTGALLVLVGYLLCRRGVLGAGLFGGLLAVVAVALAVCAVRPVWFRGFYRGGMTVSFYIGHFMGQVLLTVIFLFLVTPLGLVLRMAGKDLLRTRRSRSNSYWQVARNPNQFNRQF